MRKNITSNLTAVSIGDIKGIGIQILIESWKKKRLKNFVLITNYKLFNKYILQKKILLKIFKSSVIDNKVTFQKNSFNIFDIKAENYNQNTLNSLIESYKLVKKKLFI